MHTVASGRFGEFDMIIEDDGDPVFMGDGDEGARRIGNLIIT